MYIFLSPRPAGSRCAKKAAIEYMTDFYRIDCSCLAWWIQSYHQKVQTPFQSELWISICSWLTFWEKTNNKKHWGDMKCNTNATLLKCQTAIVSLQRSNHSGPSSLEACQNVFSLYLLQCWILASTRCFRGPLQPLGVKTLLDNEKQRITNGGTDRHRQKHNHPNLSWCWSDHSELTLCMQQCVCVRFYMCVRVEYQMDIQCWVGHTKTVAY